MKKLSLLFLFVLMIFTGCGKNVDSKPTLEANASLETYKQLNKDELKNKMDAKDSFVVYIYSTSCMGCRDFKPILESFIKNELVLIYSIEVGRDFDKNNSLISYSSTPSLAIVLDGKVKDVANSLDDSEVFMKYAALKDYIYSYFKKPTVYNKIEIDEETLDSKISNKDSFACLFYYGKCSDCLYIDKHYFDKNKVAKDSSRIYYAFDCKDYFEARESSSDPLWLDFTSKYQFNSNYELGYRNGVVPTLIRYEEGKISEVCVIFNDEMDITRNELGEITNILVTNSYYKDSPYIGKSFKSKEEYHQSTLDYFVKKIEEVLIR